MVIIDDIVTIKMDQYQRQRRRSQVHNIPIRPLINPPYGFDLIWNNYDPYNETVDMRIVGNNVTSIKSQQKYKEDRDAVLSNLKVVSDRCRNFPNAKLANESKGAYAFTVENFLDHPAFDGQNDHIRSKADQKRWLRISEKQLKFINFRLTKIEKFKRGITDIKGEVNIQGERYFYLERARIEKGN